MSGKLIVLFSRAPIAGQVKTRIARDIGADKALAIHRKLFDRTLGIVIESGIRHKLYLSAKPGVDFKWPYTLQQGLDLGSRMAHAVEHELKSFQEVVLIGSDCLDLTARDLASAFSALEDHELVLGPAADGGYYLIGMRRFMPELFRNLAWGTDSILQDTLALATQQKARTFLLETRHDVDTLDDLPTNWKAL